jgi:hypothetical protein
VRIVKCEKGEGEGEGEGKEDPVGKEDPFYVV